MKHSTSSFQTSDNLKIHTVSWLPTGEPKAIVIIVHGYDEHSARYEHVAKHLTDHEYAVYALDHRGHGKSDGLRVHFDEFDHPVNDLTQFFNLLKGAHPRKKIFLYGHSMGSLISLGFTLRHQDQLAGVVLSGTAVNADEAVPKAMLMMSGFLRRLIPKVPLVPGLASNLLSHDAQVVSAYDNDPLITRSKWRVGMGSMLLEQGKVLREQASKLRIPLLIVHGGADQITPVSGAKLIYERASSTDKQLKIYDGLYHEIHNEPEKGKVFADITAWLDTHAK